MTNFIVERLQQLLNKQKKSLNGSKLLIVGVTYKENLADYRESPSLGVMKLLQVTGAQVSYHDSYVPQIEVEGELYFSQLLTEDSIKKQDCVLILAKHSAVDYDLIAKNAQQILDTRNVFESNQMRTRWLRSNIE